MIRKIGVVFILALGSYLILKNNETAQTSVKNLKKIAATKWQTQNEEPKAKAEAPVSRTLASNSKPSEEQANTWSEQLKDPEQSTEKRLEAWENLERALPVTAPKILEMAMSPNPLADGRNIPEHSLEEHRYNREESLRVMAIQSLEKSLLKKEISPALLEEASTGAASPAVRDIAQKILEFAKKGLSYSEAAEKAISRLKVPK